MNALNDIFKDPFEQVCIRAAHSGSLHLLFEFVTEDKEEFVHIMLLVHLSLAPAERIQKFEGAHRSLPRLKVVENALDTKRDRLEVVDVGGHVVDSAAESANEEETLEQRVEVASGPLIYQTIISVLNRLISP